MAPVKQLTIPRPELCGASLLAKLLTTVRSDLSKPLDHIYAWCDSTIVLAWLDGAPKRYRTFRISAITTLVPPPAWHHMPTNDNPADYASRGITPSELRDHPLWWEGPPWLVVEPIDTPTQPAGPELVSLRTLEAKAVVCHSATPVPPEWIELRFNSYHKLLLTTAWVLRAAHNLLASLGRHTKHSQSYLTVNDLNRAEHYLFSNSQLRSFGHEVAQLISQPPRAIRNSSTTLSFNPFMSQDGLLRVGGRLSKASISMSQKHPVILSSKDHVTKLLLNYDHVNLGHCGPTLLLSHTGTRLHVVGARRLARTVCRSCVTCRKVAARAETQLMGQLPAARVTPSPPFTITGIDYAGPFTLKKGHTRKPVLVKAFLALFICFSTKAVHLEIVSDLTTEAFLACLKRFVARRRLQSELL